MRGTIKFVDPKTRDWGFIVPDDGEADVHFVLRNFVGLKPTVDDQGVAVEFELREDEKGRHARSIRLLKEVPIIPRDAEFLLDWAFLGHIPRTLRDLAEKALKNDRWEFRDTPPDPDRPLPILHSYLIHTFGRLALEKKILVNEKEAIAAFNTGLVDPRYETIFAVFRLQKGQASPWRLSGFCTAGEGPDGQDLVRQFNPLPQPPHYFDKPSDLLYDVREGPPEGINWHHIVVERINRYPAHFLEENWPASLPRVDIPKLSLEDRGDFFESFREALQADDRTYRSIMNRVKDAIELSIKRTSWNFKTAVPSYYTRVRKLQLLLPLCLISDDEVDLALAVEGAPSGNYLAHTVLSLDWAYKNARLICRPDSDWLDAKDIVGGPDEDDEDEFSAA